MTALLELVTTFPRAGAAPATGWQNLSSHDRHARWKSLGPATSLPLLPPIRLCFPMKTRRCTFVTLLVWLAVFAVWCEHAAVSETQDRKEFLDRFYPFLEPGREPPGHWAPNVKLGGGLAWQGQMGWRTRNGDAVAIWDLGEPREVENARYPDGTRGEARKTLDHGFRRRPTNSGYDRLWIYGRIDIRPDDILFIDVEQPVYQPPPLSDVPNLEADLARDPVFLAAIKDDRLALAVLNFVDNRTFYEGQDPRSWICGSRMAPRLVANLRDKGESYQDYFPGHAALPGTYPDDRPDIERSLQKRIDQILKSLKTEPSLGFPLEDLATWLGPGEHPPGEVRRVMQLMQKRPEFERRRVAE